MNTEIKTVIESTKEFQLLNKSTDSDIIKEDTEKHWLFQKGNSMYNMRTTIGRAKLFETPEILLTESLKYFQWADNNPWIKKEQVKTPLKPYKDEDGNIQFPPAIIDIPTQRPYTIEGLCLYLGIDTDTFLNYGKKDSYVAYFGVIKYVRELIENNQLEGGMVGAYNPAIVIRKLGLKEQIESKIEQTYTHIVFQSKNVQDIDSEDVTDQANQAIEGL